MVSGSSCNRAGWLPEPSLCLIGCHNSVPAKSHLETQIERQSEGLGSHRALSQIERPGTDPPVELTRFVSHSSVVVQGCSRSGGRMFNCRYPSDQSNRPSANQFTCNLAAATFYESLQFFSLEHLHFSCKFGNIACTICMHSVDIQDHVDIPVFTPVLV